MIAAALGTTKIVEQLTVSTFAHYVLKSPPTHQSNLSPRMPLMVERERPCFCGFAGGVRNLAKKKGK